MKKRMIIKVEMNIQTQNKISLKKRYPLLNWFKPMLDIFQSKHGLIPHFIPHWELKKKVQVFIPRSSRFWSNWTIIAWRSCCPDLPVDVASDLVFNLFKSILASPHLSKIIQIEVKNRFSTFPTPTEKGVGGGGPPFPKLFFQTTLFLLCLILVMQLL